MGKALDLIMEEVGALNVKQIRDVINGKYYSHDRDELNIIGARAQLFLIVIKGLGDN